MNSINILSTIGTPPPSPERSRASSASDASQAEDEKTWSSTPPPGGDESGEGAWDPASTSAAADGDTPPPGPAQDTSAELSDEKTPLLHVAKAEEHVPSPSGGWWLVPKRAAGAVVGTIRILLSGVMAPGRYLVACFYDNDGRFSVFMPLRRIGQKLKRKKGKESLHALEKSDARHGMHRSSRKTGSARAPKQPKRSPSVASSVSTAITSDSDLDSERPSTRDSDPDTPSRHTRSKSLSMSSREGESSSTRRSIRIKLNNEEVLKQRRQKKTQSKRSSKASSPEEVSEAAAAVLKSPTSPQTGAKITRYPRAPVPPRPLIPRRQPSYTAGPGLFGAQHQKTLVLDLDETLIHSMAKGGRFTTGHMVEVRLQQPIGVGGAMIGPQVPILYYVHKRPHCDEFLRKVSKWYNLIVFTASVQEYADPVIEWLELERKYFSARYYRQHCTFRNNMYIKDLAQVEPDLSKVMIVDNSPLSYAFHEDNAIPIEGWISDPTDNDLLHLIPLLEGLQYVPDVRALLALRKGQPPVA